MRAGYLVTFLLLFSIVKGAPLKSCKHVLKPYYNLDETPKLFEQFIKNFNKIYEDEADKQVHYKAFVKSLEAINRLNSDPNQTATFKINKFADYTDKEHKNMRGLIVSDSSKQKPQYNLADAAALYEQFVKDFNKTFKNEADRQVHYEAFIKSLEKVNKLNVDPNETATFAINQFADYTHEERQKMHRLIAPENSESNAFYNLKDSTILFKQFINNFNESYKDKAVHRSIDYFDEQQKNMHGFVDDKRESKPLYNLDEAPALFEQFIKDFNKTFTDEVDKQVHFEAFCKSLEEANRLNSDPNQSTPFFINQFADYTDEERKKIRGFNIVDSPGSKPLYNLDDASMLFEQYVKDFNKTYEDEADKQVHYEAFLKSLEVVNRLNCDPTQTVAFVINQFADYTDEDLKKMFEGTGSIDRK